jgi:hypothetical protein
VRKKKKKRERERKERVVSTKIPEQNPPCIWSFISERKKKREKNKNTTKKEKTS